MEINDEYIINKYIDTLERVQIQHISRASEEELNYIHNRFNDSESEVETIQRIYRGIEHRPKCIYCGEPCRPKNSKCTEFYLTCNCKECKNKEAYEKYKKTFAKNHNGLINTFQLPEVVAKIQEKRKPKQQEITTKILQTKLDRYGDSTYNNMDKNRQTCLEKYGVEYSLQSENNKVKSKETCKRKYGVEYYSQTAEHLEKRRKTNLERYGVEECSQNAVIKQKQVNTRFLFNNGHYMSEYMIQKTRKTKLEIYNNETYNNRKQAKETSLEKYGYIYPILSEDVKQKCIDTNLIKYNVPYFQQSDLFKEKYKTACLLKYNVENTFNIPSVREKCLYILQNNKDTIDTKRKATCLERYGVDVIFKSEQCIKNSHSLEANEKRVNTKRKNGTLNTSKPENNIYENLKTKYVDVERNYKTDVYPFMCDFYIPETDTYIECNFHWTHGGHWFNEQSEEDLLRLQNMKNKNTKFYNTAIDVWTKRDPLKLQTAINNHLNYLVFWNENEFNEWFKNQQ